MMFQITGSGDTTIAEWNIVRGVSVAVYKSHTGSVKTVDVKKDEPSEFNMLCCVNVLKGPYLLPLTLLSHMYTVYTNVHTFYLEEGT